MAGDAVGGEATDASTTLDEVIEVRLVESKDLPDLVRLYRRLEEEMRELHEMWPLADGLAEPAEETLAEVVVDPAYVVALGLIDGVPLGFIVGRLRSLLPQAADERVGLVELVYTEPEARAVGIAEAMLDLILERLHARGAERFDAPVLPGHRLAKNFFERAGFSARSITMHRRKR